jgi:hypothetical protein
MTLQTQAMLITLSVSCWTARKQDKKVAAEVEAAHNARDAGRYNKMLVDKIHLDPITQFAGQIRSYHYKMTLPWMDNGARLLPSKLFMEYSAEIRKMKLQYQALVNDFIIKYDATLRQDARQRLGTMYDADDYPEGYELRNKFDVETDIAPVPDGHDFRVDVGDAERDRIGREIAGKVAERQAAAQRDAWVRVRETVSLIQLRLSADRARIHDSLIENARDLSRLLPGLNVADDPQMDRVCSAITERLLVDPQGLRNSRSARIRVASAAAEILEMVP